MINLQQDLEKIKNKCNNNNNGLTKLNYCIINFDLYKTFASFSFLNLFRHKLLNYFTLYYILVLFYCAKICRCNEYANSAYPILHGNYYSAINETLALEEYSYCHAENIELYDMNLFSNDDILLTYKLITINDPNNASIDASVSSLVRMDCITGKTLWAKKLYYNVDQVYFNILKTFIINDTVWSLLSGYDTNIYYPALIASTSSEGIILEVFSVSGQYSSTPASYFLSFQDFYVFSDFSFITIARCSYNQGEFGVSTISQFDFCFFKYNQNKEFQWSTSIDYLNGIEERESMKEYKNTTFIIITTAKYYYCLLNLNITSGSVIKSQCVYAYKPSNNTNYRKLDILLVADAYVYAGGNLVFFSDPKNLYGLYLFESSSCKLVRVYMHVFCSDSFGFRNSKLMRDEFYCYNETNFFIFNSYTKEINESYELLINSTKSLNLSLNFTGNLRLPYFIKRTSAGSFVYALLRDFKGSFTNSNYNEVFIFKFDENFNTDSCVYFDLSNPSFQDERFIIIDPYPDIVYRNESIVPNVLSLNNSNIFKNKTIISNYTFNDITECIWPRYPTNTSSCVAQYPQFLLNNKYEIKVGSNIADVYSFPAFYQSQGSKFIITSKDNSTSQSVDWLTINQINSTIVISTSQVKSVGEYIILFNARLITFAIDNYSASGYTTDNYKTVFQFLNSNCVILSTNINYYVKINQLSIFTLEFYDQENDRIVIILEQYDEIGLYSQQDPSSKQKIKLFLQANSYSENPINIVATYTDSYHQDSSFYNKLNFTIYTFLVDPPLFENNLETFNANRCSNYTIVFPRVEDPNGLNSTISISQSNLDWIKLSNNTLFLNTANLDFNISETTVVTLKITNSQKAWREYNQTIVTEQYFRPTFEDMQNVSVSDGILYEFNIKVASKYKVDAVECDSNILISWISVTNDYSKMYVYYPSQAEHKKCVKLRSYDSCGNPIYSSLFYIVAQKDYNKPPSRCGSFGPLKVYVGDKSLFLIPNDLFCTKNNSKLEYSVSVLNCSIHSSLTVEIKGTDFDDNHYLYVFSNQSKSCMISIKAEDKDHQSSEIYVNVIVISCASKDCISCTNEYQSGCIKCKLNYILDDSGLCILNKLHYPDSINSIFDVCGIITLICLIIQLIMSIRIGFNALLPVEFSQTILIMFALSSLNDANLNQYAAWMQFFKLDFGFLDFLKLRNLNFDQCKPDSDKMEALQFYCNSYLLNYFYLVMIIMLMIICVQILKLLRVRYDCSLKIFMLINSKIRKNNIAYIMIHFIFSFLAINLVSDVANINNHMLLSLLSCLSILMCLIIILIKYPEVFSLSFFSQIDSQNTSTITYLTLIKLILHTALFFVTNNSISIVFFSLSVIVHAFIAVHFMFISKDSFLFQVYNRKNNGIKYSLLCMIMLIIYTQSIQGSSLPKTVVLLSTSFFIVCLVIDIGAIILSFDK